MHLSPATSWHKKLFSAIQYYTVNDDSKFAKRKNSFFSNTFDNDFFSLNTHNTENAFNYLPLALRSFLNIQRKKNHKASNNNNRLSALTCLWQFVYIQIVLSRPVPCGIKFGSGSGKSQIAISEPTLKVWTKLSEKSYCCHLLGYCNAQIFWDICNYCNADN